MGKKSIYQDKDLKNRAIELYKTGLTTREVGKIIGKSHTWVAELVKKLSPTGTLQTLTKEYDKGKVVK